MSLTGTVALVTGANAGIGKAIALELSGRGAAVAINHLRAEGGAAETVAAVTQTGGRAIACQGDLTRRDDVARVVADATARLGPIDVLVNNAGGLVGRRPLSDITDEFYRAVMDVNLLTAVLCTQAVAPGMIERKRGAIVTLTSLAAHNGGGPGAAIYAAAKAAVMAFTKGIARDLAPHGIRVNGVSPGLIGGTDFHGKFTPPEAFAAAVKTIPLGRAGTPQDVARVVAFLASEDAAFLVGETIEINGGMFMR
jgi:3-oxoacyl-[acyl-carrier protein] reductase